MRVLSLLLDDGADVHARFGENKLTAVMWAAYDGFEIAGGLDVEWGW